MFTTDFWKCATERAAKSAAQFALGALGATVFTSVGEVVGTGQAVVYAALFGAVASYLTSIASINVGEKGTPSLVETP
jgi:Putative lactococcus lactis phage r1t holin